jgi:hypothetical protein
LCRPKKILKSKQKASNSKLSFLELRWQSGDRGQVKKIASVTDIQRLIALVLKRQLFHRPRSGVPIYLAAARSAQFLRMSCVPSVNYAGLGHQYASGW